MEGHAAPAIYYIILCYSIVPPIRIMITANLNAPLMVGQTGNTLTCDVSGASKLSPVIAWTKNGRTLTQVDNSTTLSLTPLSLSLAGGYSCSITSTLLNHPVMATNNQMVIIQSEYGLTLQHYYYSPRPSWLTLKSCEGLGTRLK